MARQRTSDVAGERAPRAASAHDGNDGARAVECCAPLAPPVSPLDAMATGSAVAMLRALADPTRLGLMALLAAQREPVCVCDLVTHFALGQPTISHHLRILREAALVDCHRTGTWAYYFVVPATLAPLQAILAQWSAAPSAAH